MFDWEGRDIVDASRLIAKRDPRRYRTGLLTAGARPEGSACALQWFRGHPEMAQFLMRVEPRRWGLEMSELIAFKARVQDVITAVDVTGPDESLRSLFNELATPHFAVRWWGTLDDLKAGRGDWPRTLLARFQDLSPGTEPKPLDNRQVADLIEFLKTEYPLSPD